MNKKIKIQKSAAISTVNRFLFDLLKCKLRPVYAFENNQNFLTRSRDEIKANAWIISMVMKMIIHMYIILMVNVSLSAQKQKRSNVLLMLTTYSKCRMQISDRKKYF